MMAAAASSQMDFYFSARSSERVNSPRFPSILLIFERLCPERMLLSLFNDDRRGKTCLTNRFYVYLKRPVALEPDRKNRGFHFGPRERAKASRE